MRTVLAIFCLVLGAASAQTRYTLIEGSKQVGKATFTQTPNMAGGKDTELVLYLTVRGEPRKVSQGAAYDALGRQMTCSLTSYLGKKKTLNGVAAKFALDGTASVVFNLRGKTGRQMVKRPNGRRNNRSAFWFMKTVPKLGANEVFYRFNLDYLTWDKVTVTYTNPIIAELHVKSYSGYQVSVTTPHGAETLILDKFGIPITLTTKFYELVRQ